MSDNFKAIIVGGGPVGLIAAHILTKAGIDFVVLERRSTVTADEGASLALWPPTFRVLDQLGLAQPLAPASNVLRKKQVFTLDGSLFAENDVFSMNLENHGYSLQMFHRADIMRAFYGGLPEAARARVLLNKVVTDIQVIDDGVRVLCADGTVQDGSIVIGADGVGSRVRQILRRLALKAPKSSQPVDIDEEQPYVSTYKLMYGNAPRHPLAQQGITYEAHGEKVSTQLFVGRERMWFFVFEQLDRPTRETVRYSHAEEEAFAAKMANISMSDKLTFSDVWATRNSGGLTNLFEGVVNTWGWNRIVLAGDAAHRATPNIGWGFNAGAHDVVVLANLLRRLVADRTESEGPVTTVELDALFAVYQAERRPFVSQICDVSGNVTRMSAWNNPMMRFLDRRFWPALDMDRFMSTHYVAPLTSTVPVLEFAQETEPHHGIIPWLHGGLPALSAAQSAVRSPAFRAIKRVVRMSKYFA